MSEARLPSAKQRAHAELGVAGNERHPAHGIRNPQFSAGPPTTRPPDAGCPSEIHPAQPDRVERCSPRSGRSSSGTPPVRRAQRPREQDPAAGRHLVLPALGPLPHLDRLGARCHLTDVDGRTLLDMSMGFGAMMVGHLNPVVVDHVRTRSTTSARSSSPRRRRRPRWPSSSRSASASTCCASPSRAPSRSCMPSAPPAPTPAARRSSRSRAATTAVTTRCRSRSSRRWPTSARPTRTHARHALRGRGRHRPRRAVQRPRPPARHPRRARSRDRRARHGAGHREPRDRRPRRGLPRRGARRPVTSTVSC
jgi:hypothetical protein